MAAAARERRKEGALREEIPDVAVANAKQLGAAFDDIRPRLKQVEAFIADQLARGPHAAQEAGGYVFEGGGKRLRPAILLVVARLLGYRGDREVRYGAVVEMIHTATLVHDDIIDHAAVRRGRPTANHRWGNQLTVLLGDWLYTRSLDLALEVGDVEIMKVLSYATMQMIEGEILGLELNGHSDISLDQYLDIVRRKTAELFAVACSVPTFFSPEYECYRAPLAEYGRNLGMCFQIVDDLLDVTAEPTRLGKPVFSDLREGKLTLPYLLLLPRVNREERGAILRVLETGDFVGTSAQELRALLDRHRVLAEAREVAAAYGRRAVDALAALPESAERAALAVAPTFVIDRDY